MHGTSSDTDYLGRCPALKAYLERVGAVVRNFRRFVIEEADDAGYKKLVATISIKNGTIGCDRGACAD